ncbi:hypothetical protein [Yoonia sp. I 8.24]|uniref:hypothetical protein n=1 Tax=Yoonia sp. I 8.24 TaxID=1537229 RepID=UPI001EE02430|nr:hypothetical protein [Yoonia sp. I 8.24]MCG3269034.1 hypothetical protein [Yoonia sp. I 8.24]
MTAISILLIFKIGFTFVTVIMPFMLFSQLKLETLTSSSVATTTLFRLYGTSTISLLILYGWGIWQAQSGSMPWIVVCVGIFSNLTAPAVIFFTSAGKQQRILGAIYGAIGVGLIGFAIFPTAALNSVF